MPWPQTYNPLGSVFWSTVIAALPVVVLLSSIAIFKIRIHLSALVGLATALAIALWVYGMPLKSTIATAVFGGAFGLFPIGWIILNLIFLYQLTVHKGLFKVLRESLATLSPDPRIQVILIAFSFGAFFEGAAGFGTPVAVTAVILVQLGFKPLPASGLSLIANTAPVAFGSLGTPILALSKVTGLDLHQLSAMVGRQLPFFSLVVPFWVVWAMVGFRGMLGVWPVALTAGVSFAIPQFLVSNFHGPWLVDIVASLCSMGAVFVLLKFWRPKEIWRQPDMVEPVPESVQTRPADKKVWQAWAPWIVLSLTLFLWGLPTVKKSLDSLFALQIAVPHLHKMVVRVPPVAPPDAPPEAAVFNFNGLSATGSAALFAALVAGLWMGFSVKELAVNYVKTVILLRFSLITIAGMLALGYITRYSGTDATLGLALAKTGSFYPFFGTMLGWLGVALTGSDTSSNVLFGSLQQITANKADLSPILMCAANSSGGVMGKMVDAQSIVEASTATNWYGHEGDILRFVFFHSLALATLVGFLVYLQAYVAPFTYMVVR